MGLGPEEGVEGVVVGGREAVFGAEAVVHGGDDGRERGGERGAEVVGDDGGGVEEDESAAVDVDDEGDFSGGGGCGRKRRREVLAAALRGMSTEREGSEVGGVGEGGTLNSYMFLYYLVKKRWK